MKHEKFVKFIEDISVDGNEYLGESIMEAYGLCFYGVSLRNEADKLLESISGNKALCEALGEETLGEGGVIEKIRKWPRKKIMGLLLGALITMTAAKGMAADNPQVIDGARDRVIEQLGGDGDGDDEAVDKMVKGAVKKYGDKIEKKAAEKGGDKTDTTEDDNGWKKYAYAAKNYLYNELEKNTSIEDIKQNINDLLKSNDQDEQDKGQALNKALREMEKYQDRDNTVQAKKYIQNHLAKGDTYEEISTTMQGLLDKDPLDENTKNLAELVLKQLDGGGDYRELHQNGKLKDAGMSNLDISKYRFVMQHGFGDNSAIYNYGDAIVTSDNAPDEAEMKKLTQQVKKILSKS